MGEPTTALDAAAGGSGAHDGTYVLSSTLGWGNLLPGGVGGKHVVNRGNNAGGTVISIGNPSDLRLLGAMTVMAWYAPDDYYYHYNPSYIASCTGLDETEAENDLWSLEIAGVRIVRLRWENGLGVDINAVSGASFLNQQGWTHVAVTRYEMTPGKWGCDFYADGQYHSTDDNTGSGYDPPTGGGNSLPYLGRIGVAQTPTSMSYDSVRVYDTEESAASILAVYNAEVVFFEDLPVKDDYDHNQWYTRPVGEPGALYRSVQSGPNSLRENAGWYR